MKFKTIEHSIYNKNIAVIKLNRTEKKNAMNSVFFDELNIALEDIANNDNIWVLVIKGGDGVFSAGGDLKEIANLSRDEVKVLSMKVQTTFEHISNLDIPVIACVNGIVYGGGLELLIHCDIAFCSDNTKLCFPEINIGLIPGAGGTSMILNYFSKSDATYYLMTGENIPLDLALKKGIIQKMYPETELENKCMEFAKLLSEKSKHSLRAIKETLNTTYYKGVIEGKKREVEEFSSVLFKDGKTKIKSFFNS